MKAFSSLLQDALEIGEKEYGEFKLIEFKLNEDEKNEAKSKWHKSFKIREDLYRELHLENTIFFHEKTEIII